MNNGKLQKDLEDHDQESEKKEQGEYFVVEMLIGGNWENTWTVETIVDGVGQNQPQRFDTIQEAQDELDDHIQTLEDEGMDDDDDFRITHVIDGIGYRPEEINPVKKTKISP